MEELSTVLRVSVSSVLRAGGVGEGVGSGVRVGAGDGVVSGKTA